MSFSFIQTTWVLRHFTTNTYGLKMEEQLPPELDEESIIKKPLGFFPLCNQTWGSLLISSPSDMGLRKPVFMLR